MTPGKLYLQALEYGAGKDHFRFTDLIAELGLNQYDSKLLETQIKFENLFKPEDQGKNETGLSWHHSYTSENETELKLSLSIDDSFRLLEHEELNEARQASLNAQENAAKSSRQARNAFIVSILALAISAIFSIINICVC